MSHTSTQPHWDAMGDGLLDDLFDATAAEPDCGPRYELGDILGQGGQGQVIKARDVVLDTAVAIKRVVQAGPGDHWIKHEMNMLAKLDHPAIPRLLDAGQASDGCWFIVMPFIAGQSLGKLSQHCTPEQALRWFDQIAGAVGHAHDQGLIHRDLKPENILIGDDGHARVVDWGLAEAGQPRQICGSSYYASPEQLDGQVADKRSDIYSLGVILYVLLARQLPYSRQVDNFFAFRRERAGIALVPLHLRRPGLPRQLGQVCQRAMAMQAGARYNTVSDMLADLDRCLQRRMLPPGIAWGRWIAVAMIMAVVAIAAFAAGQRVERQLGSSQPADIPHNGSSGQPWVQPDRSRVVP